MTLFVDKLRPVQEIWVYQSLYLRLQDDIYYFIKYIITSRVNTQSFF